MGMNKGFVESLRGMIDYRLLSLFTMVPALVLSVDHKGNCVDAKPLIKTQYSDGTQGDTAEVYSVPIFVLSANNGSARVTLPVKRGDTVLLLYSQRSIGDFFQSDGKQVVDADSTVTHDAYPILVLPCLFTKAGAKEIDSNNIVIENASTSMVMEPSGNITATCPTFNINGNLKVSGVVDFDGDYVKHRGTTIDDTHTHAQGTDSAGNSQAETDPPT